MPDTRRRRLVIVEDDAVLARTIARTVRRTMDVRTLGSAAEATALFEAEPGWADVVLLDLALPDAKGADVYARLRALRPDVTVVVCSGSTDAEELAPFTRDGVVVLPKPASIEELRGALERGAR